MNNNINKTTVFEFLSLLNSLDIKVWIENDQLRYRAPKGAMTPAIKQELIERKTEIINCLQEAKTENKLAFAPILPVDRDSHLHLSFSQQRLWFIHQLDKQNPFYNGSVQLRITGALNVAALEQSFNEIIRRHETLRTVFPTVDGLAVQKIIRTLTISIPVVNVEGLEASEIQQLVTKEIQQPFDLSTPPLLRVTLLRQEVESHLMVLTMHHIIIDAWSMEVLFKELAVIYDAFIKKQPNPLPELTIQYADFALWQRQCLTQEIQQKQLNYWKQQLVDAPPLLELPTDYPRPPVQTFSGSTSRFPIDKDLTSQIVTFSQKSGVTLFMTLLTAYAVLLHRYSGQDDICIGSPFANRNRQELESLIGFFANTLVLRTNLAGNPSFHELLGRVREISMEAYAHQDFPFEMLVEVLQPQRDLSHTPLFQVTFILQDTSISPVDLSGLNVTSLPTETTTTKFDLTLLIEKADTGLVSVWEYNTDLFNASTIERMAGHFQTLLAGIVANPEEKISQLPMLTQVEQHQLLVEWNNTKTDYPDDKCIHQLFEEQCFSTPNGVAVVFGDRQLTYNELNCQANQLAHYLKSLGVGADVLVGLCVERSLEMVVGLLAILKAGGAYVPLDPEYPQERLQFMLADTQVKVLLTQEKFVETLPQHQARVVCLDTDWQSIKEASQDNLNSTVSSQNLAYVIYTSGSTGTPKGVIVTHQAVNRLVFNTNYIQLTPNDRVAQAANIAFDAATFEIWGALLHGAKLVILNQSVMLNPKEFAANMRSHEVSVLFLTTALFNQLASFVPQAFSSLRYLLFGGEAVDPRWVQEVLDKGAPQHLLHVYGPTENTTFSTWYLVKELPTKAATIPIGRAISNTQIYLLDQKLQPVPIGIPGELYLGGAGLARGYLNRPELTQEKFISNPFEKAAGSKLYKTGDLGRYLPDGNIEYIRRIDNQVKLRGFRIELGEIEAALGEHDDVKVSCVIAREDSSGSKCLVAYVVPKKDLTLTTGELRQFLADKLPGYMVPSAFVILESLPLTPNGKVNRRALPEPNLQQEVSDYVLPNTEAEKIIADIWQQALKVEKVGIYNNFFELGGHSLLLVKINQQLQEIFGLEVSIVDMFNYPTIHTLSQYLISKSHQEDTIKENNSRIQSHSEIKSLRNQHLQLNKKDPSPITMTTNSVDNTNEFNNSEIAIIAVAGRFPGAKDIESFWQNIHDGVESISRFTDEELLESGVSPDLLNNPNYVKARPFVSDIEWFDANFFAYSAKEAELIDPQQRLFLELAWEAIEKAGYDPQTYNGSIGVYAGVGMNHYAIKNIYSNHQLLETLDYLQLVVSNEKDFLPTRVAYKLNLTGPAVNVQTACSTSLVAVHQACQSLLNGECDMALAGGVTISIPQKIGYLYEEGMILSPDGHCRSFDAKAQGTIAGSGAGIVVLKRLEDAISDRDHIHAIIKGSAINNDGAMKVGYTAPSVSGQAAVIKEAQAIARVEAETISYIEAHGTATPLGDPIEIAALTQAFRQTTDKKGFCAIGSVKTNLGHLDTAAGVAGLIKTVLALQHKILPPSLHFETPNPKIDFANSPFYVNTTLTEWKTDNVPRRAGVSSFGMGGTNAHVILEEAPVFEQGSSGSTSLTNQGAGEQGRNYQLLVISAKTENALENATANLITHLKEHPEVNLGDVAYTLNIGRRGFNYRRILIAQNLEDAVKNLSGLDSKQVFTNHTEITERSVVFMFPGQGSQYVNMAREIYETETVFKEQIDYCSEILQPLIGTDLSHIIYPNDENIDKASQQLQQTGIAQPAIFVIEYALAKLWQSWGINPQAAIGHSIGEYVAATLAGVFSLEDALSLVAARGKMMQQLPTGAMLSVPLPAEKVKSLLGKELSLAAINQPAQCVVSGSIQAIEALQNQLAAQGIECRRLHNSHAFHSHEMEPILEAFTERVKQVSLNPPKLPYISNLTGTWITVTQATNPDYYAQHLRSTVLFAQGVEKLLATPEQVLLEVGAGHTLTTLAKRHPQKSATQTVLNSVRHPQEKQSDLAVLYNTLGQLWLTGVKVDWLGFYSQDEYYRLPLPTYPFERQRYWIEPPKEKAWGQSLTLPTASKLWTSLIQAGKNQANAQNVKLNELTYQETRQWLDRLCTAYINSAIQQLGAFSDSQDKYSLEDLLAQCQINPRYQQLFCRWVQILVEQGQLQQQDDLFTGLVPCSQDFIDEHLKEVRIRFSDGTPIDDLDLVQRCGENLAAFVVGKQEPLDIFNELVYQNNKNGSHLEFPLVIYYNSILRSIVEHLVKLLPSSVNLRILEIGGGTGLSTQTLLPVLPYQKTHYTFTDIGNSFLIQAQRKFKEYPFVEYRLLDIDKSPTEQGFEKYSFDLVIAANVLHATRNIDQTLSHVRSLLAPGGFLLLWEVTQPQIDFDISWGLLLKPLDDKRRCPGQPFITQNQWFEALREQDFVQVVAFPETEAFEHHIIMAQASAPVAFSENYQQQETDQNSQFLLQKKSDDFQPENLSVLHSRPDLPNSYVAPRNDLEEKIADIWQELLGIKLIGIYDNFFELGGDSLIGVQFITRLRNTFSVQFSVASLFEFPTIADISLKLEQQPDTNLEAIDREEEEIAI